MMIYYRDNCVWLAEGDGDPTPDERKVFNAVRDAIPHPPETVFVNDLCWYDKVAEGVSERGRWVEYLFNVRAPASAELYGRPV